MNEMTCTHRWTCEGAGTVAPGPPATEPEEVEIFCRDCGEKRMSIAFPDFLYHPEWTDERVQEHITQVAQTDSRFAWLVP